MLESGLRCERFDSAFGGGPDTARLVFKTCRVVSTLSDNMGRLGCYR